MLQWTDKKAWQTRNINNKTDSQKKQRLGTVSKNFDQDGNLYTIDSKETTTSKS